jgi:hypothetical protein
MPKQKHYFKKNGIFEIHAQVGGGDTINGKPINSGVMFMSQFCGETKLKDENKTKLDVCVCFDGSVVLGFHLKSGVRHVKTNLEALVNAAIEAGAMQESIDFTDADEAE